MSDYTLMVLLGLTMTLCAYFLGYLHGATKFYNRLKEVEEILRYYANTANYITHSGDRAPNIMKDAGKKAKNALKLTKGKKK